MNKNVNLILEKTVEASIAEHSLEEIFVLSKLY